MADDPTYEELTSVFRWDRKFLHLAEHISSWSKDQSTKAGCIIVGDANQVLSMGYNGMPRGVDDSVPGRHERPEKYLWFEHAERNAIFNAARHGIPLKDTRIYVNWHPCSDCARAIIQCGITEVVIDSVGRNFDDSRWNAHKDAAEKMFAESHVTVRWIEKGKISE